MKTCLVCGAEKKPEDMHIIVLSEAERQQVADPLDEYPYCRPCWKILSDPVTAPALISGIARHRLQRIGVDRADQLADKFRSDLAELAKTRRS